jgi:phage shock protein PspC (stress-responsive transcriptional regulator)
MEKKLYRSKSDRMIAGVCGGLGEYLNVDPVWFRLFFVILLFATGFGFWAYLIMWIIMPEEGRVSGTTGDTVQANVQDIADRARDLGQGVQRGLQGQRTASDEGPTSGTVIVGAAFILLGAMLLLNRLNLFWWLKWDVMWPLMLVLIGGALIYSRVRS